MLLFVLGHTYHFRKDHLWEYGHEDSIITSELHWEEGESLLLLYTSVTQSGFSLIPGSTSILSPETAQVAEWRCINPPYAGL